MTEKKQNQGEGNKEADQRYRESTREFVEEGKVDAAAEQAKAMTDAERKDAEQAAQEAKKKARS